MRSSRRPGACSGAVTLEFLIALPFVAVLITLTVQSLLLLHARVVVDYAACAAARSAAVWYPASTSALPTDAPLDEADSEAALRILHAAAVACVPLSANLGGGTGGVELPGLGLGSGVVAGFAGAREILDKPGKVAYAVKATNVSLAVREDDTNPECPVRLVEATVVFHCWLPVPVAGSLLGTDPAPEGYAAPGRHFTRITSRYTVPLEEELHARAGDDG